MATPTRAGVYNIYDRATKTLSPLPTRPALDHTVFQPMFSTHITARDGLPLIIYYTLTHDQDSGNTGKPRRHKPMVVVVHSGPWARDDLGFDPMHQWLANRGYAVLSVNYRGSSGLENPSSTPPMGNGAKRWRPTSKTP